MHRKMGIVILLFFLVSIVAPSSAYGQRGGEKEVLVITSEEPYDPWTKQVMYEIMQATTEAGLKVKYHVEYVGANNYNLIDYQEGFLEVVNQKYQNIRLDCILHLGNAAVELSQLGVKRYEELPPILVGGINDLEFSIDELPDYYGGAMTSISQEQLNRALFKVQPDLERLYVLGYENSKDLNMEEEFNYQRKKIPLEVIILTEEEVNNIPHSGKWDKEALLVFSNHKDQNDQAINHSEFFHQLRELYQGPIYVCDIACFMANSELSEIGQGPIGGVMQEDQHEGALLGQQLVNLLQYPEQYEPRIAVVEGQIILDYRALNYYGFPIIGYPWGFHVVNEPSQEITLKKDELFHSMIAFIFILMVIIFGLIVSVRRVRGLAKELAESNEGYKTLITLLPEPLVVVDDGYVSYVNQKAIEYFEAQKGGELVGLQVQQLLSCPVVLATESGTLKHEALEIETLLGRKREADLLYSWHNSEYRKVIIVLQDLTEQKRMRERMEYDQLRTEFFSTLSHELRTPVNVISSTAQLLELYCNQYDNEQLTKYNQILRQNSNRLVRLINNLIDSTKIAAGFIQLNKVVVNVVEVTENLTLSILPYAQSRNIKVIFDTEDEEIYAQLDLEKYERILLNILSNSIKYNKENGEIYVYTQSRDGMVEVLIEDTGIGIPESKLDVIFQRFVQVNKSSRRNVEGSGIGLYIVKSLVDLHQGTIIVESKEDEFTRSILEFPLFTPTDDEVKLDLTYTGATHIELSDIDLE